MPNGQTRRCSQREIREGKGPRRLAERSACQHMHELTWNSGGVAVVRRLAVAVAVLFLVIAATVVQSDDYSPPTGPYVGAGWGNSIFISTTSTMWAPPSPTSLIPTTMPGRHSWDFDSLRSSAWRRPTLTSPIPMIRFEHSGPTAFITSR